MWQLPITDVVIAPGDIHEWRLRSPLDTFNPAGEDSKIASFNQEKHFAAAVAARRELVSETFWIGLTFIIEGPLDLSALESAFYLFVARHEVLRCGFEQLVADLRCDVMAPEEVALDHTHVGAFTTSPAVLRHVEATFDRAINTLSWPLFVLGVVAGPEQSTVYMGFDHILCDGISLVVAVDEVARSYAAYSHGHKPELPPVGSYLDFGAAQRRRYADIRADGPELAYWRSFIAAAGSLFPRIPLDLGVEAGHMYPARNETVRLLDDAAASRFERLCERAGGRQFMGLLAVLGMALNRVAGTTVWHGFLPVSERRDERWRGSFGWFVNTLPVSFPVGAELDFATVLRGVDAAFRTMVRHVDVPFVKAWQLLAPEYFGLRTWPYPVNFFSFLDFRRLPGAEHADRRRPVTIPEASHSNTGNLWFYRNADGIHLNAIYCDTPAGVDAVVGYRAAIVALLEELAEGGD